MRDRRMTGRMRRTEPARRPRRAAKRGSVLSFRNTTELRASPMALSRSRKSRPTGSRSTAVTSTKGRSPATTTGDRAIVEPVRSSANVAPTRRPIARNASIPIGVIGAKYPCATLIEKYTRVSDGTSSGSGYKFVIGRAWTIHSRSSPSTANSTSCGPPSRRSMRRPISASSTISASLITGRSCLTTRSVIWPADTSTTLWSGSTAPETTASPRPGAASMTAVPRLPLIGWAVNMTPAAAASTIR